ncbi:MAG TPA: DDE-type integrase/transposase/recombinase, partial [Candidatus Hodarchaeales archaeon]|nr:DDE-type integrase/transposase/recombinase [Candidatus Hodarchaeales archaeon]
MRHYNILPVNTIRSASLSKDALRRLWWMDWYHSHGKNAESTCRHFGISKSVFYRWKNRYKPFNLKTLEDDKKTRRPRHLRQMTTDPAILAMIYDIRLADREKSKWEIQEELKRQSVTVGRSAIQKVINRHPELLNTQHIRKLRSHRKLTIARLRASREMREKYPGALVQIDTKHFYVLGIRFYLFCAVDCKSRYGYVWCYKNISSQSGADFLERVITYFPFNVDSVQTDNGSEYLLNFHKACDRLGLTHYFSFPHTPKMNGRAERIIQTVIYEYFNWQYDLLPDLEE